MIEWLILFIVLTAMCSTCILLLQIDLIVHQLLYQYGLRFSQEWANPYWTYFRAALTLSVVAAIGAVILTLIPRPQIKLIKEIGGDPIGLWRTKKGVRGRHIKATGAVFLIVSALFLILAYSTRYLVFEVTSIMALLLGIIFIFLSMEPYIKTRVSSNAILSSLIPLCSVLKHLAVGEQAVYIPPTLEQSSGRIFIPKHSRGQLPVFDKILEANDVKILDEGVLLPTIGNGLLQLYEEEMGDLTNVDLTSLMKGLPKVIVDRLGLAEGMDMIQTEEKIKVTLKASAFRNICSNIGSDKILCEVTGCPLCSSIAEAIAKATGRTVYFLKCHYNQATYRTNILYRLGLPPRTLSSKRRKAEDSG